MSFKTFSRYADGKVSRDALCQEQTRTEALRRFERSVELWLGEDLCAALPARVEMVGLVFAPGCKPDT